MVRLAINGYGRIGRSVLRALYEGAHKSRLQIVAINEPADLATVAHLTKYDTTHGRFPGTVSHETHSAGDGQWLIVNGDRIAVSHSTGLTDLPWREHNVDVVLECYGGYTTPAELSGHLAAGAKKVLLSQPGAADIPAIVWGINHTRLQGYETIISAASCTTNCVVPVIKVLDDVFGIEYGITTTIHSAMNDQPVLDAYHHTDLRKTRAAFQSIIPVDTGLAAGISRVLPALGARFASHALRVPTINVSAMQLAVSLRPNATGSGATVAAVNAALARAAAGELAGVLGYTDEPLASCDFNHDARSGIVDASQTRSAGNLINVLTWFDNEWGYANRMLDVVAYWTKS
ncbi:MAG: glyceraldehyde 3-phosphate dehydrogenase NAD-binding domain-containing protein [Spongiibacteraceae bacterium]